MADHATGGASTPTGYVLVPFKFNYCKVYATY